MAAPIISGVLILICATIVTLAAAHAEPKAGGVGSDLISRSCANVTADFCRFRVSNDYCVSTLRSDTRSARARHPRDLALVAMDLAHRGAAAVDAKIGGMESKKSGADLTTLRYCRADYAAMARLVPLCRGMVKAYRPDAGDDDGDYMRVYYPLECARKMLHSAKDCRAIIFYDDEFDVAVRKEVADVARQTALAKAMVEQMVGFPDPYDGFHDE